MSDFFFIIVSLTVDIKFDDKLFCQWLCYTFPIFTCNYHLYMQLNTSVDVYFDLHALSSLCIKHKVQHLLFERCSYKTEV